MNLDSRMVSENNSNEMHNFLSIISTLLEHKYFIVIITSLFAILGLFFALASQPIYQASAVLQVEEKTGGLPGMSEISEVFGVESNASTEIELLKSRKVIGVAVDKEMLDLVIEPNYFPLIGDILQRKKINLDSIPLLNQLDLTQYVRLGEFITIEKFSIPDNNYEEPYEVHIFNKNQFKLYSPDGNLILTGENNKRYEKSGLEIEIGEINALPGRVFFLEKFRRFNSIKNYQDALAIREKGIDTGIIVLSIEDELPDRAERILDLITRAYVNQNVERQSAEAAKSLQFLDQQLPAVKEDLENAESAFNKYQVKAGSVDITVEAESLLNQVVDIESNISSLKLEKAELDRKYTTDHPVYKSWLEQLTALVTRKNELHERVKSLPRTQQEIIGLKRDVAVSTEIYTQMLANIQELDIVRAGSVGNVRVIDDAAADIDNPVRPQKKLIVLGAILLGFSFSVIAILVRKFINPGIKNPEELESIGLPIYASIPLSLAQDKMKNVKLSRGSKGKDSRKTARRTTLLAEDDPTDTSIECLRSLRTSLHFAMLDSKNNIIMIGGATPMVGKSFVSANLAAVIAQSGQKLLLIDADMRRGYLHTMFGHEAKGGLSDLLIDRMDLDKTIKQTGIPNLMFLSRGEIPPNPSELLMDKRFTELMDVVRKQFDYVIIDTPPILAVTDASIISRQCGVCLLVVRHELSTLKEVYLAKKRFELSGTPIKGSVLNGIRKSSSKYGYSYGYYDYEYKNKA
ncbi:polysaccharide biosynthesis tyrosine autokinase [Ketobacter sp. MCCC 1A13808]|uniref:polysaccharide biosynthesis tyrosine autokinase n=1 Tax=Ketobacter sp. MCCC 1A13808 TaxID=2602738 RepID=UPI0012EB9C56|nr:polysaccharide biosynthesis tyrosine autokinase [Ketobacter sp. MCCC 1A13808]MVF13929.1 polysaccharide biosynthesis tyrosine autokinase [Ketobacter sp. MCCC 1A13808]